MEGFFNIDKPTGISSHDVVNRLRRLTGIRRIGHAGTLDPLATGVMLLGVGRGTRLIEYLVGQPKWYRATIRLGQETDSYDADGAVVAERPFSHITLPQIEAALAQFVGDLEQLPPMYSAIKKDGQPLYKLARQGIEIERKPRAVTIFEASLIDWSPPLLTVDVHCSSGTYIRSLAFDMGRVLECGGHIAALRRTAVGEFSIAVAVALDALTSENSDDYCLPLETAVRHLPRVELPLAQAQDLLNGRFAPREDDLPNGTVAALFSNNQFWGIITAQQQRWKAKKMLPPVEYQQ